MIYTVTLNPAVDKEFVVPDIAVDQVLRATTSRVDIGGKGFNVSRMLKALGTNSVAMAFAGGHCGSLLRDGLYRLGISSDFLWVDGESRANISIQNGRRDHYIKVNEPGSPIKESDFQALLARISELAAPGDWWVLAGSLPPGAHTDSYAHIIDLIQQKGGRVILDSSSEALAEGCQAMPFLVKPNQDEAAELTGFPTGTPEELSAAAAAIHLRGPQHVVISCGAQGALLSGPEGVYMVDSPAVPPGNPTGAGDALVGGIVWALSHDKSMEEAVCWGVACGASTAAQAGTAVGAKAEVSALREQIEARRLETT